ncbi:aldehyde dehydrogenase family protein, partial [Candidatus Marsarchaeota archaeon]|nr:aldehyde dehydrogenase family protein [Candidatus Marsarchaeota archaeon]
STFSNESTYRKMVESGQESKFDELFDQAAKSALAGFGKTFPMYIGGKQVYASSVLEERSPIDRKVLIGKFQKGTREDARSAISAARKAFAQWGLLEYKARLEVFKKAVLKFREKKFELAAILSYENGKSRYESVGEVDEAIDFINYYITEMERNRGYSRKNLISQSTVKVKAGFQGAPAEKTEKITIKLKPYGVFGVIAPFNFPISISVGMSTGALITGNTVVFKPSSTDNMSMLTGLKIYEIFKESGMPDGVFNYITGPGSEVGDELAVSKDVDGIAFTGSRDTGMSMAARTYAQRLQKVFVVEMGGKNPVIVTKHAEIEEAVEGVISAAFGFAGQKCSALSRVYVHESIKEVFLSKLIARVRELKVGNPLAKENYIGPLISEGAYKRYVESVEKAKSAGRMLYGGSRVKTDLDGFYVEPVIVEIRHDHELVHKELFLPFITVESFNDFGDAIRMANDVEYGLTAGMYSKNRVEIREFEKRIEAGTVYVNRAISATTGAIVGMHTFVGWKGSSLTGKGTGSKFYLQQFMREQSFSVTG